MQPENVLLEASMSGLYAGICFRSDCDNGNVLGAQIGKLFVPKLNAQ